MYQNSLCSSNVHQVQKAQAFFTVSIPGMPMVDVNGNTIDPQPIVERFIYVECRFNGKPKIDSVFYNGIFFAATVANKEELQQKIGVKKDTEMPVLLTKRKGNHLWRIDLVQVNGSTLQHNRVKKITVKGLLDKTKFSQTIAVETEIQTPDRY